MRTRRIRIKVEEEVVGNYFNRRWQTDIYNFLFKKKLKEFVSVYLL